MVGLAVIQDILHKVYGNKTIEEFDGENNKIFDNILGILEEKVVDGMEYVVAALHQLWKKGVGRMEIDN